VMKVPCHVWDAEGVYVRPEHMVRRREGQRSGRWGVQNLASACSAWETESSETPDLLARRGRLLHGYQPIDSTPIPPHTRPNLSFFRLWYGCSLHHMVRVHTRKQHNNPDESQSPMREGKEVRRREGRGKA